MRREQQERAKIQGLRTSTFNCIIKKFEKEENGNYKNNTVKKLQAVDDFRKSAVLKLKK